MYEVRWTYRNGGENCEPFDDDRDKAWKFYDEHVGENALYCVDSVGLYYTDGDGNEKELASWSR